MSQTRTIFKGVVFSLAATVLVVVGVGQVLAKDWQVETTRTVRASPERVAALVRDLATWSVWSAIDIQLGPQTAREVTGQAGRGDQRITWTGQGGKAVLAAETVTADALDYSFGFEAAEAPAKSRGRVEWVASADGCTVRWVDRGTHGNVMLRWFGWFGALQEKVKQMQGASLEGLQQELERSAAAGK